jgi:hypothetical protein
MTYFPNIKLPIWVEILSTFFSYLFFICSYFILFIGILNISGLLEFNILYYIGDIILMIISLYCLVNIQSMKEPEGW